MHILGFMGGCNSWLFASGYKSIGLKHALRDWSHLQITAFARDSDSEDDYSMYGIIYQLLYYFKFLYFLF